MARAERAAAVLLGIAGLTLAGCSGPGAEEPAAPGPTATSAAEPPPGFKACLLRGSGDFDDEAFGRVARAGLQRAASELGIEHAVREADPERRYAADLDALVEQGCDAITTVRYPMGDATRAAARRNPLVDFSIVDFSYDRPPENLKGLLFDIASPAFLAGYLAAGASQSGVVGTFGGAQIPTVTEFMDGFAAGVERYGEDNGTDVRLLGWDAETQTGTFINDFGSRPKAASVAAEMISDGADVLFPVAGPAGVGALQAVRAAGARAVWPETDGCVSVARFCDVLLTSVVKAIDVAVLATIRASVEGAFDNTTYVGTLGNGGVGLAPLREPDAVPEELTARLRELEQQVIDGEVEVR